MEERGPGGRTVLSVPARQPMVRETRERVRRRRIGEVRVSGNHAQDSLLKAHDDGRRIGAAASVPGAEPGTAEAVAESPAPANGWTSPPANPWR